MFYLRKKPKEKFREVVELFDEKTNEIVRKIHFKNQRDFNKFIEDFTLMRYPGYRWRYVDKKKKFEEMKKVIEEEK
ncbi:MAG: hypothetical protein LN408_05700 [Candidatus Thermoplasmatota archaeon]|nr:hypothetical protein [Candidatus Thermoplasmatota archaeon]MCK5300360.1 hypothetical protein [Thermoplasmatales archaeon]